MSAPNIVDIPAAWHGKDMVKCLFFDVTVKPDTLTWLNSFHLNRKKLLLKRNNKTYQCEVTTPAMIHYLAQKALKEKLRKNKI